jgi:hypothetical protein
LVNDAAGLRGWGTDNPAFRQMLAAQFMPGAMKEQMDQFNELQRKTTSPSALPATSTSPPIWTLPTYSAK